MHPSQPISPISTTFVNTDQATISAEVSFPQAIQITNIEAQPSTSQGIYSLVAASEKCSEEFQFNVEREAVDDKFWSKFKDKLERKDFNELFNDFLLTSWKPSETFIYGLKQANEGVAKGKMSKSEDIIFHYNNLVETLLYTNLKLRAMHLIHSIMDLSGHNSQLNERHSKVELKKVNRKIDNVNKQYNLTFDKVYLPHQMYLKKANHQKKASDLIFLNNVLHSLRSGAVKYSREVNNAQLIKMHLPYINECLQNFRSYQKIPHCDTSNSLLTKLIADKACSQEESVQPPKKRRRVLPVVSSCSGRSVISAKSSTSSRRGNDTLETEQLYLSWRNDLLPENEQVSTSLHLQQQNKTLHPVYPIPSTSAASLSVTDIERSVQTELLKFVPYPANEMKLTCFLNKMIGRDTYFYYEINVDDDEQDDNVIVTPEKYYHSLIMLSALNSKTLLFKTKVLMAELIQTTRKKNKIKIEKNLFEEFSNFMNSHLIYEENMAISSDERINIQPTGMCISDMRDSYFSNCKSIKTASMLLTNALQRYNYIIQNFDKNIFINNYFEFINSKIVINKIKNSYSLPRKKVTEIIQSVLDIPSALNLTEEQLSSLKFKINRPPVSDSFWQALKNENLSDFEFRRYYFLFIFTSWKSSSEDICELDKTIKEAIHHNLDLQLQANLVEKHFQEKLRYQAFHFIHHILQVIKRHQRVAYIPLKIGKRRIEYEMEKNLNMIRENYQKTLAMRLDYLTARASIGSIDVKSLHSEIKTCHRFIYHHANTDAEDVEKYLLLLNKIIDSIEKNQLFSNDMIFDVINGYVNNETHAISTQAAVSDFESYASRQLQFVPSAPISTMAKNFSPQRSSEIEATDSEFTAIVSSLNPSWEQSQLLNDEGAVSKLSSVYQVEQAESVSHSVSHSADETRFTHLLKKMIGKDDYLYYEINIDEGKGLTITPEKYYYSSIMLSALNAKILLLRMKILIGELTLTETKHNKIIVRRKLRHDFASFIKNHLIYEKNLAVSLEGRINQQPENMSVKYMKNNYFANCKKIKIVNDLFENTQKEYNETIQEIDENTLLKYYVKFIISSMTLDSLINIKDIYSLPNKIINQAIRTVFNIPSTSNLTQEQLSVLKFQIDRAPVNDLFWQALRNNNFSESEFKRYYFSFILTSWRSSPSEIRKLDKAIKWAIKNHFDSQLRANLVEKCFQENLRHQAFCLIHQILQLIRKYQKLKNLSPDNKAEKRKIGHENAIALDNINGNYRGALKVYLHYLTARNSIESIDINKICAEIKACQCYIYNKVRVDTEDTERYILLINKILDTIIKDQPSLHILELVENYMDNSGVFATSTPTGSNVSEQLQFVPVLSIDELSARASKTLNIKSANSEPASPFAHSSQLDLVEPVNVQLASQSNVEMKEPLLSEISSASASDMQLEHLLSGEALSSQFLETSPFGLLELQLEEPFLNFETLTTQPSSSYDTLQNAISFSLPLTASQQTFDVAQSDAQDDQILRPSFELEKEQMLEQQTPYVEEINTFDFFNR